MGGDIALRGGAGSDLLAVDDCARQQCGAARHGLGPSAQRAVSGVRGVRWMARGRRRQQEALAVDAGSAWRAGTGLRPALRRWLRCMAHLKELESELSVRFRKQTRAHWLAALDEKGV